MDYKPIPTVVPVSPFDPAADGQALRTAMKGFGTDEQAIIDILTVRTNAQRQEIKAFYLHEFGRDLIEDLKSELGLIVTGVRDPVGTVDPEKAKEQAEALYAAGEAKLGTDEEVFNWIMAHASFAKLRFFHAKEGAVTHEALTTLQSWGVIAQNGEVKCKNNHIMLLRPQKNFVDGYGWSCDCYFKNMYKKRVRCKSVKSIRHNTFFHNSHLTLYQIVMFTHLWTKNIKSSFIISEIEITPKTATDWASFHREVVYDAMIKCHSTIGGIGKIVEIDESKFGKRKYHRGHHVEGQWIFGGVERGSGKCFLVPVENRDKETLLKIIKEWIEPGTTIISDCWKSYDCLTDEGFQHLTVNHSVHFKDPDTGAHTNNVESMWQHTKASLPQYSRKKTFFGGYMAKFMFLKKCRNENLDPLEEFYKCAGKLYNGQEAIPEPCSNDSDDSS